MYGQQCLMSHAYRLIKHEKSEKELEETAKGEREKTRNYCGMIEET